MARSASRVSRRAAISECGLKNAAPSGRPSGRITVTIVPGSSALAPASIVSSLEKIQGCPSMARLSPPGWSLMRGRSLFIDVPSFAERDAIAPRVARADHHAILELHDVEAALQRALLHHVSEVFQRIAQIECAGAGLDQG